MTAVGGGSFSFPVTVSLRQSSDNCDYDGFRESSDNSSPPDSGGPPAAVIVLAVLVTILLLLLLTQTSILVYMYW